MDNNEPRGDHNEKAGNQDKNPDNKNNGPKKLSFWKMFTFWEEMTTPNTNAPATLPQQENPPLSPRYQAARRNKRSTSASSVFGIHALEKSEQGTKALSPGSAEVTTSTGMQTKKATSDRSVRSGTFLSDKHKVNYFKDKQEEKKVKEKKYDDVKQKTDTECKISEPNGDEPESTSDTLEANQLLTPQEETNQMIEQGEEECKQAVNKEDGTDLTSAEARNKEVPGQDIDHYKNLLAEEREKTTKLEASLQHGKF